MDRLPFSLAALFASLSAPATRVEPRPAWRAAFPGAAPAAFVLLEPLANRYRVLDEPRARQRRLPGGTFEMALAIAGLETGAIADEREVFAWDGRPSTHAAWERDQTMASALRSGASWTFQRVARRIGKPAMSEWVHRLGYGNRNLAGGLELFWLQGGLRASAFEQVDFVHRLAEGRLSATQRAQRLVREALVVEKTRAYALYAKTAHAALSREGTAWCVGWVERRGRLVACFALERDAESADEGLAAARRLLHADGILP